MSTSITSRPITSRPFRWEQRVSRVLVNRGLRPITAKESLEVYGSGARQEDHATRREDPA